MCKYCENLNNGRGAGIIDDGSWTDRFNIYKDPEGKYRIECYADQSSPINFCPMCGRKLTEFEVEVTRVMARDEDEARNMMTNVLSVERVEE